MADVIVLFVSCVRVGLLAFGGGNSAIPLLEAEVVPRWLTAREYSELVSINFGLPGISMMKLAGMIGLRVAGMPGLFAATVGIAAPQPHLEVVAHSGSPFERERSEWSDGVKITGRTPSARPGE